MVANNLFLRGSTRYCPVCERGARRFLDFGVPARREVACPWCGSLERHRLVWTYLRERTDLFDAGSKAVLHVAPEACLRERFADRLGGGYVTADLKRSDVSLKMDIAQIDQPDESYDVIYCSHVLEHVPEDRRAMSELRRVLKSEGWAVLLVPITADETFEDPTVTDPAERLRLFGQSDHVRRYGPDYLNRLEDAGFAVKVITAEELFAAADLERMRVGETAGDIYFCTKR